MEGIGNLDVIYLGIGCLLTIYLILSPKKFRDHSFDPILSRFVIVGLPPILAHEKNIKFLKTISILYTFNFM